MSHRLRFALVLIWLASAQGAFAESIRYFAVWSYTENAPADEITENGWAERGLEPVWWEAEGRYHRLSLARQRLRVGNGQTKGLGCRAEARPHPCKDCATLHAES